MNFPEIDKKKKPESDLEKGKEGELVRHRYHIQFKV